MVKRVKWLSMVLFHFATTAPLRLAGFAGELLALGAWHFTDTELNHTLKCRLPTGAH